MGSAPHGQSLHRRFVLRCDERREKILALLAGRDDGAPTAGEPAAAIGVALHDLVGEAKLLGQDRLSAIAETLRRLVAHGLPAGRLREATTRLAALAAQVCLDAPAAAHQRVLRAFLEELRQELATFAPEESSPALEVPPVPARILVFDDSPIVREVLTLELEDRGHPVAVAGTLAEFEAQLRTFDPQLIFLDINMPEAKGDEVCRMLRGGAGTKDVPVVLLSSLPEAELAALAARSGADGFLSKQMGMEGIVKHLDELLSGIVF